MEKEKKPWLTCVGFIALRALVLWMAELFSQVDRWAGLLQIPYLLWVAFAGYLNFGVWRLNWQNPRLQQQAGPERYAFGACLLLCTGVDMTAHQRRWASPFPSATWASSTCLSAAMELEWLRATCVRAPFTSFRAQRTMV